MDDARLRRISFVTEHYGALRGGVTRALAGPIITLVGALQLLIEYIDPPKVIGLIFGLANIFGFAALVIVLWLRSRRWLDRRFGRVGSGSPLLTSWGILSSQVGYFVASRLDDTYGPGNGIPSIQFLFIAAVALWCCVRLWPRSVHYLVVAAVSVGIALPFATLSGEQAVDAWELRGFVAVLLAWTAAGLIDLAILFNVLPRCPAEEAVSVDA